MIANNPHNPHRLLTLSLAACLLLASLASAQQPLKPDATPYARWENGPPGDPGYFPIGVWLQNPRNAERYRAAGVNLYIGLWRGPTAEQLQALKDAGMPVICHQNEVGLTDPNNDIIVGWMHGDEPDNAQRRADGQGWGPPVSPEKIVADYERLRRRDPTRPVLLNLGQGVAWDAWHGRGVRTNHPEDYPRYIRGADIISFDIYPVVHDHPDVAGKLQYVARGVGRLVRWADDEQVVWNVIEAGRINNTEVKPTAEQVRAEVWMSIIHGSRGIVYFVHQFEPRFIEASLLEDEDLLAGVTAINRRVRELAPVLNSPTAEGLATVRSADGDVPVALMAKRHGGAVYLFAVCMRDRATTASFELAGEAAAASRAEVIGEQRSIDVADGRFEDAFGPYAVHLYRLR